MDNAELKSLLGRRVLELRQLRGLTQQQVADKMDIDLRTYCRIEKGVSFPSRYIMRLATALNVTLSQLFEFEHLKITIEEQQEFIKESADKLPLEYLTVIYKMINSMYN